MKELKNANFAYISNVYVHPYYRGKHIGSMMVANIINIYRKKCFEEIALGVLADNSGVIRLYQNLGFEQSGDIFIEVNDPRLEEKPDVFSMINQLDA